MQNNCNYRKKICKIIISILLFDKMTIFREKKEKKVFDNVLAFVIKYINIIHFSNQKIKATKTKFSKFNHMTHIF